MPTVYILVSDESCFVFTYFDYYFIGRLDPVCSRHLVDVVRVQLVQVEEIIVLEHFLQNKRNVILDFKSKSVLSRKSDGFSLSVCSFDASNLNRLREETF